MHLDQSKKRVHLIIHNVPSGPRLSLRQHSTTQWPTMCIARQDYAHASHQTVISSGRSGTLPEGQTGSCPSEAQRVKVQGWKGYSRGGHVFGKGTMSQSLPASGLGSAVTSPRDVQGQSPINLKFFLAFYSSFPSVH